LDSSTNTTVADSNNIPFNAVSLKNNTTIPMETPTETFSKFHIVTQNTSVPLSPFINTSRPPNPLINKSTPLIPLNTSTSLNPLINTQKQLEPLINTSTPLKKRMLPSTLMLPLPNNNISSVHTNSTMTSKDKNFTDSTEQRSNNTIGITSLTTGPKGSNAIEIPSNNTGFEPLSTGAIGIANIRSNTIENKPKNPINLTPDPKILPNTSLSAQHFVANVSLNDTEEQLNKTVFTPLDSNSLLTNASEQQPKIIPNISLTPQNLNADSEFIPNVSLNITENQAQNTAFTLINADTTHLAKTSINGLENLSPGTVSMNLNTNPNMIQNKSLTAQNLKTYPNMLQNLSLTVQDLNTNPNMLQNASITEQDLNKNNNLLLNDSLNSAERQSNKTASSFIGNKIFAAVPSNITFSDSTTSTIATDIEAINATAKTEKKLSGVENKTKESVLTTLLPTSSTTIETTTTVDPKLADDSSRSEIYKMHNNGLMLLHAQRARSGSEAKKSELIDNAPSAAINYHSRKRANESEPLKVEDNEKRVALAFSNLPQVKQKRSKRFVVNRIQYSNKEAVKSKPTSPMTQLKRFILPSNLPFFSRKHKKL